MRLISGIPTLDTQLRETQGGEWVLGNLKYSLLRM
jgi:hypothetical protein